MGEKKEAWKNCIPDGIVIIGGGIFIGGVVSVLTLQSWPILFGMGIGLGLAYDYCDRQCRRPLIIFSRKREITVKKQTEVKKETEVKKNDN